VNGYVSKEDSENIPVASTRDYIFQTAETISSLERL
jgi:hypothetical protein